MEKELNNSKLTSEAVESLKNRNAHIGADKTTVLLGKIFNVLGLTLNVLDKEAIKIEVAKNPKLDFMLKEKFIFRGILEVHLLADVDENKKPKSTFVYVNNDLLALLTKSRAVELKSTTVKVDGKPDVTSWTYSLSPKGFTLTNTECKEYYG